MKKLKSKALEKTFCNNIKEVFDSEELAETSSIRYSKQIDHFQNELKTKGKVIHQLLESLSKLNN